MVADQTLPVASDDPTVQTAVAAAHDALASGVTSPLHTIVGPALTATLELLESHAVTVEDSREQLDPTDVITTYFAPACIGVGDLDVPNTEPCSACNGGPCESTNIPPAGTPMCLIQGGSVIDDVSDTHTIIHATRTTTDTYRTATMLALRATVLDEFTVYAAKATPKLKTFGPVTLADALGTADYDVKSVAALGPPAAPLGATASDGVTHLLRYPVKRRKGAPKFTATTVDGTNGCGPVAVQALKPESLLTVRVDLATFPPPLAPGTSGVDAFLCYKAKGPKLAKGAQVEADRFESRRYDLTKVTRLCEPVTTSGSGITATPLHRPGALLTCY